MNYYDEIILEIKNFIAKEKYTEALNKIETELSMPYYPNDFGEIIIGLKNYIIECLESSVVKKQSIDANEVFKLLKSKSKEERSIAIKYLSDINLRKFINELKEILIINNSDNDLKILILYSMALQKIDDEINIFYNNNKKTVNPMSIDFEKNIKFVKQVDDIIDNSIGNDNISIALESKAVNVLDSLNNFFSLDYIHLYERAAAIITYVALKFDQQMSINFCKKWFDYDDAIAQKIFKGILSDEQN